MEVPPAPVVCVGFLGSLWKLLLKDTNNTLTLGLGLVSQLPKVRPIR